MHERYICFSKIIGGVKKLKYIKSHHQLRLNLKKWVISNTESGALHVKRRPLFWVVINNFYEKVYNYLIVFKIT